MKSYSSREILKILQKDGWYIVSQSGSHIQLKHDTKPNKTTVPHPRKILKLKTLKSIQQQSGITLQ